MIKRKVLTAVTLLTSFAAADDSLRTQNFDRDPGWEGHNNRTPVAKYPTVVQDFGFSQSNFAGKAAGEMGGLVTRAPEPAFYADKIGPKTLDDKMSASGTFAFTDTKPGGGVFFGFFKGEQPGSSGRPISSLGLDLDTEGDGGRLAVRLITAQNQSCGTFVTAYLPGKYRPTSLRKDGTRYTWKLDYDPDGAAGRGQFKFSFHGDLPKPIDLDKSDMPEAHKGEARVRFPNANTFSVDLPEGYKKQGTTFDHFGLLNMMKAGGNVKIYFDDLTYDGRSQDFSSDPAWDSSKNRNTYKLTNVGGAHDFGFSDTANAGGKPGEIGGTFWRTDKWGYYADKVGELSFEDRLEVRGKVTLKVGGPDADMCFGWFKTDDGEQSPVESGNFLGISVGGPTRVGHYFMPGFFINENLRGRPEKAPVLHPGKQYDFSLVYDPKGNGTMTAKLGDESVTYELKPGAKDKAKSAMLDRFGMFAHGPGGQVVKLFLDDLQYTVGR